MHHVRIYLQWEMQQMGVLNHICVCRKLESYTQTCETMCMMLPL